MVAFISEGVTAMCQLCAETTTEELPGTRKDAVYVDDWMLSNH